MQVRERVKKSRTSAGGGKENLAETSGVVAGGDIPRGIAKKLIDKNIKKNMKPLAKIGEEDPLGKVCKYLTAPRQSIFVRVE